MKISVLLVCLFLFITAAGQGSLAAERGASVASDFSRTLRLKVAQIRNQAKDPNWLLSPVSLIKIELSTLAEPVTSYLGQGPKGRSDPSVGRRIEQWQQLCLGILSADPPPKGALLSIKAFLVENLGKADPNRDEIARDVILSHFARFTKALGSVKEVKKVAYSFKGSRFIAAPKVAIRFPGVPTGIKLGSPFRLVEKIITQAGFEPSEIRSDREYLGCVKIEYKATSGQRGEEDRLVVHLCDGSLVRVALKSNGVCERMSNLLQTPGERRWVAKDGSLGVGCSDAHSVNWGDIGRLRKAHRLRFSTLTRMGARYQALFDKSPYDAKDLLQAGSR
jgi:hypothetical protein